MATQRSILLRSTVLAFPALLLLMLISMVNTWIRVGCPKTDFFNCGSSPALLLRSVAGRATGIRDVDALANLDPDTLRPSYLQAASLQKPWGW